MAKAKDLTERIRLLWVKEMKKKKIVLTEKELDDAVELTKKKLKYLLHKK
jgi:hypothetical protein